MVWIWAGWSARLKWIKISIDFDCLQFVILVAKYFILFIFNFQFLKKLTNFPIVSKVNSRINLAKSVFSDSDTLAKTICLPKIYSSIKNKFRKNPKIYECNADSKDETFKPSSHRHPMNKLQNSTGHVKPSAIRLLHHINVIVNAQSSLLEKFL